MKIVLRITYYVLWENQKRHLSQDSQRVAG